MGNRLESQGVSGIDRVQCAALKSAAGRCNAYSMRSNRLNSTGATFWWLRGSPQEPLDSRQAVIGERQRLAESVCTVRHCPRKDSDASHWLHAGGRLRERPTR